MDPSKKTMFLNNRKVNREDYNTFIQGIEHKFGSRYGKIQEEVRKLQQEKSALYRTEKLKGLEKGIHEADRARQALDRKIHESLRALQQKTEKEISALRQKIDAIGQEIRKDGAYVKISEEIQACENRRREMESKIDDDPKLKAIAAKAEALGKESRKAEERIKQLPELKKLASQAEQEKDGAKKGKLREKYNRLFAARRATDPAWQKARVAVQGLDRERDETRRRVRGAHVGLAKNATEHRRLQKKRGELESKLRKSHPRLSGLEEAIAAKREPLNAKRKQIEEKARAGQEYKKAVAACAAARKAVEDERKRLQKEKAGEAAKLDARIGKLNKDAEALWDKTMRSAGVHGPNPYPGKRAGEMHEVQKSMVYHTTADWEDRTDKEVLGTAPPKMKAWLKRVRGY